jgi:hypothetical protein
MELCMDSWRDMIFAEFAPHMAKLILVSDPDGLLLEEGVSLGIKERGFDLIPFEDPMGFRYAYESKFRARWDHGDDVSLVVVLHSSSGDLEALPYDLLQTGRKVSFSLGRIFPNLSYPVVEALGREHLETLFRAQQTHKPDKLGDNATKEYILRHVYGIAPELIKQSSDLLRVLIRIHYRGQNIPGILNERFIQLLSLNPTFRDWPLDILTTNREEFFAFLQERWPVFLDRMKITGEETAQEKKEDRWLRIPGPQDIPFEHDDVRVYIDNLFLEGSLQTIPHHRADQLGKTWAGIGIRIDPDAERVHRIEGLIDAISASLPAESAHHSGWFKIAFRWAQLTMLLMEHDAGVQNHLQQKISHLQEQMDSQFTDWVLSRYAGLINLPPVPPVMLHHIPRFLSRFVLKPKCEKVAFIMVDGLALDQWVVMRKEIKTISGRFTFQEDAVFAWVPTITSTSRQAAFAGKPPLYFPKSIYSTDKESSLWAQFWIDSGLTHQEIAYQKGLGDGPFDAVEDLVIGTGVRIIGLVVDKVDKIMHGMELGTLGMHNQVRQWTKQGFFSGLLDLLFDNGFRIFLSSDHGNIEAKGVGKPLEGSIADIRGERVRIYSDEVFRSKLKAQYPEALSWQAIGLPEDYLPLLAPGRKAFVKEDEKLLGHGGISIEELIVPFVQVKRRSS